MKIDKELSNILAHVDHTLLKTTATWDDIKTICDDAVKYKTASVCVAPFWVKKCAEYLDGKIPVCTVIGFPNGYNTTAVKCAEASDAVANGADEIDMVANLCLIKDGLYENVLNEINSVKEACHGKLLKVIVETCDLTESEKIKITEIVDKSKADFIKTSTGFSKGGATFDDIKLFKDNINNSTKIKAAGGISSLEDAKKFLELGASRLGTSRIVKIVKENK